jgi:hypothetical protein
MTFCRGRDLWLCPAMAIIIPVRDLISCLAQKGFPRGARQRRFR